MTPPPVSSTDQVTGRLAVNASDCPNPRLAVSGAIASAGVPPSPPPPPFPPMPMSSCAELPGADEQPAAATHKSTIIVRLRNSISHEKSRHPAMVCRMAASITPNGSRQLHLHPLAASTCATRNFTHDVHVPQSSATT